MNEQDRAVAGVIQELLRRRSPSNIESIWGEMSEIMSEIMSEMRKKKRCIRVRDISDALKSLTDKDILKKDRITLNYRFKIGLVERYIGVHVPYPEIQERIKSLW
jgi:hypothetical protein